MVEITVDGTGDGRDPPLAAPAARRGRPLAPDRTDAILDAASELFDEVGFDQLTVQDIAQRAGVGLATLYRRWPTKHALLIDALGRRQQQNTPQLDGPPLEVLRTLFGAVADSTMGEQGEFLPGLVTAIRADAELADTLLDDIIDPLRAVIRAQLDEVLGPDHPQIDLLVDLVPGVCVFRALVPGDTGDAEQVVGSVMALIEGLVADAGR
jgi:AcrR family transcriptional regulator